MSDVGLVSFLDVPMTPETVRRLRREAEAFIVKGLEIPDHVAAALALLSDQVVIQLADALARAVLTTMDR